MSYLEIMGLTESQACDKHIVLERLKALRLSDLRKVAEQFGCGWTDTGFEAHKVNYKGLYFMGHPIPYERLATMIIMHTITNL